MRPVRPDLVEKINPLHVAVVQQQERRATCVAAADGKKIADTYLRRMKALLSWLPVVMKDGGIHSRVDLKPYLVELERDAATLKAWMDQRRGIWVSLVNARDSVSESHGMAIGHRHLEAPPLMDSGRRWLSEVNALGSQVQALVAGLCEHYAPAQIIFGQAGRDDGSVSGAAPRSCLKGARPTTCPPLPPDDAAAAVLLQSTVTKSRIGPAVPMRTVFEVPINDFARTQTWSEDVKNTLGSPMDAFMAQMELCTAALELHDRVRHAWEMTPVGKRPLCLRVEPDTIVSELRALHDALAKGLKQSAEDLLGEVAPDFPGWRIHVMQYCSNAATGLLDEWVIRLQAMAERPPYCAIAASDADMQAALQQLKSLVSVDHATLSECIEGKFAACRIALGIEHDSGLFKFDGTPSHSSPVLMEVDSVAPAKPIHVSWGRRMLNHVKQWWSIHHHRHHHHDHHATGSAAEAHSRHGANNHENDADPRNAALRSKLRFVDELPGVSTATT